MAPTRREPLLQGVRGAGEGLVLKKGTKHSTFRHSLLRGAKASFGLIPLSLSKEVGTSDTEAFREGL